MNGFTLDTSGRVNIGEDPRHGFIRWPDLSPFAQGYVEAAMLATEWPDPNEGFGPSSSVIGFDWLAPETLAAMLRDCEAAERSRVAFFTGEQGGGRMFWELRQNGAFPAYPPLTLYLRDDGRIYQRPAALPMGVTPVASSPTVTARHDEVFPPTPSEGG